MSVGAMQEAVISVTDLDGMEIFFRQIAGYETLYKGNADASQQAFWNVPDATISEVLMKNPAVPFGYLRLVKFHGVEQKLIRNGFHAWDTGGLYNLNIRVHDAARKMREMRDAGWMPHSDLHEYNFSSLVMREVMLHGRDGLAITLVERVAPPLEGWNFTEFSHVYNALQTVRDFDASKQFYVDQLGFVATMDAPVMPEADGDNVFGLPHNLAPQVNARLAIFKPPHASHSTVEIIHLDGATGHDFSANAVPPNLGVLLLRFEVENLETYYSQIVYNGIEPHIPPAPVTIEPYGDGKAMSVLSPDGAWLEFIEMPKG
ncbi:MAG: hypothetical protein RLP44_26535 [Aggregatilineales bacterium]